MGAYSVFFCQQLCCYGYIIIQFLLYFKKKQIQNTVKAVFCILEQFLRGVFMDNIRFIENIKNLCKQKKITAKQCFEDCGINRNFMYDTKNGQKPSVEILEILSGYFNVSIDYLLGRTDNPNGSYVNGDNSFQNVVGNHSSVTITEKTGKDKLTDEFMQLFDKLDFSDKVRIINIVNDIMKN